MIGDFKAYFIQSEWAVPGVLSLMEGENGFWRVR